MKSLNEEYVANATIGNDIEVSAFESVRTIAFANDSLNNGVTVWVCENKEAFDQALAGLKSEEHIRILGCGNSHVQRAS
jgi:hypothetical protein